MEDEAAAFAAYGFAEDVAVLTETIAKLLRFQHAFRALQQKFVSRIRPNAYKHV